MRHLDSITKQQKFLAHLSLLNVEIHGEVEKKVLRLKFGIILERLYLKDLKFCPMDKLLYLVIQLLMVRLG